MNTAGDVQPSTLPGVNPQWHETPEKPHSSGISTLSAKGAGTFTIASGFHVDGRDVLLRVVSDELMEFACTNRIARLARSHGGFTTSCSGPLTRVQITVTALRDPLMARKSLLHAREKLMRFAEAVPSTEATRCRNIETYVSDLTRDTSLLVVHLLFEGHEAGLAQVIHATSVAMVAAMENIIGGNAHMQLPTQRNSKRLVRADIRLPAAALFCGRYSGQCIGERIVQLHQLTDATPSQARNHNVGILRGVASVMSATGNNYRELDLGAHAWAARNGVCSSLAHWEMDARDYLLGTLVMPVLTHLGCGTCPADHCTGELHRMHAVADADDLQGSTEVLVAVALAQSLATLRTQAIGDLQQGSTSPAPPIIDIADFGKAVDTFTDTGTKE